MSTPGWYPDPGGAPGQFRYWSGTGWSANTTAQPGPEPGPSGSAGSGPPATPPTRGPRRTRLIIAVATVLVLVVVASIAAIRLFAPSDPGVVTPPPSTAPVDPSASAPESSPTEQPSSDPSPSDPATPSTPATPSPQPSSPQPSSTAVGCPPGDPAFRQDHPTDDRIHGGGLSFPKVSGYAQTTQQSAFFWAYDVDGQSKSISPTWSSMYAVGAVPTFNGFDSPRTAAELILQCTVTSPDFYRGVTRVRTLSAKRVTVGGQSGWSLRTEVRVRAAGVTVPGDILQIVVVDTESPESLAMFWACVPLDDPASLKQLDATLKKLRPEQ